MIAVKPTQVREQFKSICDKVVRNNEIVVVPRAKEENVVIVSEKQYNVMLKAIKNAAYLDMVDESIEQLESGNFVIKTLEELRQMEQ